MRKLKLETQLSLDGYTADKNGSSNWMIWNWGNEWTWDKELQKYHTDLHTSSDTILISSNMAVEGFVNHWERVAENKKGQQYKFAKAVADSQKIVFSKTLKKSTWNNTIIAKGNFVDVITELKNNKGKDIIAYGGPIFASSLISAGLVDEFHLFINPTLLGRGIPFFDNVSKRIDLKLISSKAYSCGITVLNYGKV